MLYCSDQVALACMQALAASTVSSVGEGAGLRDLVPEGRGEPRERVKAGVLVDLLEALEADRAGVAVELRSARLARLLEAAGIELAPLVGIELAASLAGAEVTGTDLAGELAKAELTGAELAGDELAGAELAGEELTGEEPAGFELAGIELAGLELAPPVDLAPGALAGLEFAGLELTP